MHRTRVGLVILLVLLCLVAVFFVAGWASGTVDWPNFNDERALQATGVAGQFLVLILLVHEVRESRLARRATEARDRDSKARELEEIAAQFLASASSGLASYQGSAAAVRQALNDESIEAIWAVVEATEQYRQAAYGNLLHIEVRAGPSPLLDACADYAKELDARRAVLMDCRAWLARRCSGQPVTTPPDVRSRLRQPAREARDRCLREIRAIRGGTHLDGSLRGRQVT